MATPLKIKTSAVRESDQQRLDISQELIAHRAYALYLARGAEDGHDLDDWLQAERELQEVSNLAAGED